MPNTIHMRAGMPVPVEGARAGVVQKPWAGSYLRAARWLSSASPGPAGALFWQAALHEAEGSYDGFNIYLDGSLAKPPPEGLPCPLCSQPLRLDICSGGNCLQASSQAAGAHAPGHAPAVPAEPAALRCRRHLRREAERPHHPVP